MHFHAFAFAVLIAGVTAQTSIPRSVPTFSTTAPPSAPTADLASLVNQLPRCAVQCFSSAANDIKCAPTDFKCLCANSDALIQKIGPCVFLSNTCESGDISRATALAPQICAAAQNANPAAQSSASSVVTSVLGGTSTHNAAPARTEMVAMGIVGVAGAMAVLAL